MTLAEAVSWLREHPSVHGSDPLMRLEATSVVLESLSHYQAYFDQMAHNIQGMKRLHENTDLTITKVKKEWE